MSEWEWLLTPIKLDNMRQYFSLLKFARKRFLQYKFDKLSHKDKDKEIVLLMSFMYASGISSYYRKYRDAVIQVEKDLDVINARERERDEQ
jgi:hypothetical protein